MSKLSLNKSSKIINSTRKNSEENRNKIDVFIEGKYTAALSYCKV